ncbi:MAG: ArdC family protein [Pyrinomonadaceae bacterium]
MHRHSNPSPDVPKWSALLVEAVNKPGLIMEAYSAFHHYSIGNQLLAMIQCQLRGLEPGPINTFPGWQALGRNVKRGERALMLCMPITRKHRDEEAADNGDDGNGQHTYTAFVYKPRWFVISQTLGEEFAPVRLPEWDADRALAALDIEQITFSDTDGNSQGNPGSSRPRCRMESFQCRGPLTLASHPTLASLAVQGLGLLSVPVRTIAPYKQNW